jgi:hypothetical protein
VQEILRKIHQNELNGAFQAGMQRVQEVSQGNRMEWNGMETMSDDK